MLYIWIIVACCIITTHSQTASDNAFYCGTMGNCVCDIKVITCNLELGFVPVIPIDVRQGRIFDLRNQNLKYVNIEDLMYFSEVDLRQNPLLCKTNIPKIAGVLIRTDCHGPTSIPQQSTTTIYIIETSNQDYVALWTVLGLLCAAFIICTILYGVSFSIVSTFFNQRQLDRAGCWLRACLFIGRLCRHQTAIDAMTEMDRINDQRRLAARQASPTQTTSFTQSVPNMQPASLWATQLNNQLSV